MILETIEKFTQVILSPDRFTQATDAAMGVALAMISATVVSPLGVGEAAQIIYGIAALIGALSMAAKTLYRPVHRQVEQVAKVTAMQLEQVARTTATQHAQVLEALERLRVDCPEPGCPRNMGPEPPPRRRKGAE